jgi:hypothetical protein
LQHWSVRASSPCYRTFTLAKGSSPGFGSTRRDCTPCSDSLSLRLRASTALNLTTPSNSPAHSSIGTRSGLPARAASCACGIAPSLTVGKRFQLLFHSPNRGTFHLSLTVLVHYRSLCVSSLGTWSSQVPAGFLVSRGTHERSPGRHLRVAYGAVTRYGAPFQTLRLRSCFLTPRVPC